MSTKIYSLTKGNVQHVRIANSIAELGGYTWAFIIDADGSIRHSVDNSKVSEWYQTHASRVIFDSLCLNGCGRFRSNNARYCSSDCGDSFRKWIKNQKQLIESKTRGKRIADINIIRKALRFRYALYGRRPEWSDYTYDMSSISTSRIINRNFK